MTVQMADVHSSQLQMPAASGASGTQMLPLLYRTEERYGWSVGMRAVTHVLLAGSKLPEGPVVDLGCGGGRMISELGAVWPDRRRYGVDLNARALMHASESARAGASFARAHLHDLPFADDAFALCLALDAYDQRGVDLGAALAESRRVLRDNGLLVVRVSAHSWLRGPHDDAFNTGRRYEEREVLTALRQAGLVAERVTFANTLLSGPAGAVRLLQRWRLLPFLPSLYTTRMINALLAAALSYEARWLRGCNLPGGMSLYVVARKAAGPVAEPSRGQP